MDLVEKRNSIKKILCQGNLSLTDSLLNELVGISQEVTFPKEIIILNINEQQKYVYLVLKGIARSYTTNIDGNDITKLFVKENELLVGESIFADTSLEAFETLSAMSCLRIESERLRNLIFSDDNFKNIYIRLLENTLKYKMQREYNFQSKDAKQRYLQFKQEYPSLESRAQQNVIASYLGITKETLSRIRKNL